MIQKNPKSETTSRLAEINTWGRWLRLYEAAAYVHCSQNTFKKYMVNTGIVRPSTTDFGLRYDRQMIDEYLESKVG